MKHAYLLMAFGAVTLESIVLNGALKWSVFYDEQSGAEIKPDRFYGFGDAGGIAGDFDGYETRAAAVAGIPGMTDLLGVGNVTTGDLGTTADELGVAAVCVLNGIEYVQALARLGNIEEYGVFGTADERLAAAKLAMAGDPPRTLDEVFGMAMEYGLDEHRRELLLAAAQQPLPYEVPR